MRISDCSSDVCSSDLLRVDVTKGVLVAGVVEIDLIDLVDHLPDQRAILHVVIGVFERGAHDARAITFRPFERQVLQLGEELIRSEEHTYELQSLMRISYAVFCLKKKIYNKKTEYTYTKEDSNG